jgi:hypothetical protein
MSSCPPFSIHGHEGKALRIKPFFLGGMNSKKAFVCQKETRYQRPNPYGFANG